MKFSAKMDASHTVGGPITGRWPKVCIVIVNWNKADLTIACLSSLAHLDYASFDVLVVDNGSVDGSPAAIRSGSG